MIYVTSLQTEKIYGEKRMEGRKKERKRKEA